MLNLQRGDCLEGRQAAGAKFGDHGTPPIASIVSICPRALKRALGQLYHLWIHRQQLIGTGHAECLHEL